MLIKALGLKNDGKRALMVRTNNDDGNLFVYDLTAGLVCDLLVILLSLLATEENRGDDSNLSTSRGVQAGCT